MVPPRRILFNTVGQPGCGGIHPQNMTALPVDTPTIGVSVSKFRTSPGEIELFSANNTALGTRPATTFTFRQIEYTANRAFVFRCSLFNVSDAQMELFVVYKAQTGVDLTVVLPLVSREEGSKDLLSVSALNKSLGGKMVILGSAIRDNCRNSEYLVFFEPWVVDPIIFADITSKLPVCGNRQYSAVNLASHVEIIAPTQKGGSSLQSITIAADCKEGPSCMYGGSPMKICVEYEVSIEMVSDEKPTICPMLQCPACGNTDKPAPLSANLYS